MIYPAGWLLISVLTFSNVEAPLDGHIGWQFSSIKQSRSEWSLVFTATIDRGWHLYSQSIEPDGPMPTSFEFEKHPGIKLLGELSELGEGKHIFDSTFVMDVVWYEDQVVFTQRIRARRGLSVSGKIDYSVCSEERCVPGTKMFSIALE